ncbi:MAG: IPT/TIG domain-containing protein [Candidatus Dormibacteria bacterium]
MSASAQYGCVSDGTSGFYSVDLETGTVGTPTSVACAAASATADQIGRSTVGVEAANSQEIPPPAATSLIPPPVTFSYYEYLAYSSGCAQGATNGCVLYVQGASTANPTPGGVIVLDFGSQCNSGATYGVQMFGSTGCTPDSSVHQLVQEWMSGYESDHGAGAANLALAVGTSNSFTAADPSTGYEPASLETAGADWYANLVGAGYSSGAAPLTLWGASDIEESGDGEWYNGSDTIDWVGGYSAAAFPSVPVTDCSLAQRGFLLDFGDFNGGGLAAADWSESQVYDVAQGITGTCALPEIYYSGDAPEWVSLSDWAQSQGAALIDFTGVMVEPGGSASCPPSSGATLLSASCAWSELQSQTGQAPSIAGITQIATALQGSGPQVTGLSPPYGPQAGGSTVSVTGTGFLGAQTVYFGNQSVAVTAGEVNSNGTAVTVVSPAEAPGYVDVVVVTGLGSSPVAVSDQYQFLAPPCTAVTASLTAASAAPGFNDQVSATATCPSGADIKYSYFTQSGGGPWTLRAAWIGPTWNWQTAGLTAGSYAVLVWASDGPYSVPQVQSVADLTVAAQPACTALTTNVGTTTVVVGTPVVVTASGSCPTGALPEYAYFTKTSSAGSWTLDQAWTGPQWSWLTMGLAPGSYELLVWVSDGPYSTPQAQAVATFTINALTPCSAVSLAGPSTVPQGQVADFVATATCAAGTSPLFSYFISTSGGNSWTLEAAWTGATWELPADSVRPGIYQVLVWVSDGPYTVPQAQSTATTTIGALTACTTVSASGPSTAVTGLPVVVTATAACPTGTDPRYSYFVRSSSASAWTLRAAWIRSTWTWQTAGLGDGGYQVLVWVSDGPYTTPQQQTMFSIQLFTQSPCTGVTVSLSPSTLAAGQPVAVTAAGTCPEGTVARYSYFTSNSLNGPWTLRAAWIGSEWTWSPSSLPNGTYYVLAWVSGAQYQVPEAEATASFVVNTPEACSGVTAAGSPSPVVEGQPVTISATAACPAGTNPLYSYFTANSPGGPWYLASAWTGSSWTWATSGLSPGDQYVLVWASDGPYTVPQVEALVTIDVTPITACSAVSISAPTAVASGQPINATATATCPGGAQVEYSFFSRMGTIAGWTLQAAWTGQEWTWSTVGFTPGAYQVLVWASDGPYTLPQAQASATITVAG